MLIDLSKLVTESQNHNSHDIDILSTLDILKIINKEDQKVALAIQSVLPKIALAVDVIVRAFSKGGRLIYIGAGTSGRIGILDASECPPTYGTDPEQVKAIIAGGVKAVFSAVENAEDDREQAIKDLEAIDLSDKDVLVGLTASGRTPYVVSAIEYANKMQVETVGISCNPDSPLSTSAAIGISPVVGAEVITGSSRMKAGTAQKLILNMLTTTAMIKMGKVFGNLMVDVAASNLKLLERQIQIVMAATECSRAVAEEALNSCDRHCKTAIVMILNHSTAKEARELLAENKGFIRRSIQSKGA